MPKASKKSFLDYFKFNDADDEFDDDLFDEVEEDDFDDIKDDFDTKPQAQAAPAATPASSYAAPKKPKATKPQRFQSSSSKLVSFNKSQPASGSGQQLHVVKPEAMDDAQMIVDFLRRGQICVINTETIDVPTAQRIIDFIGGACYSLDGTLQAISGNIFVAAPSDIYVSGDLRDEILSGDTSTVSTDYDF